MNVVVRGVSNSIEIDGDNRIAVIDAGVIMSVRRSCPDRLEAAPPPACPLPVSSTFITTISAR